MAIEIVFDVFITNEYGVEKRVTDNVSRYAETRKVGMIYNVCEMTLTDFSLPQNLSGDGILRIRVERSIDGVDFSDSYIIDDMSKKKKSDLYSIGKSVGALLLQPYVYPTKITGEFDTYNELFDALLGSTPHSLQLPELVNTFGYYEIDNSTNGNVVLNLCAKFGIDIYVKNGEIVLEPKKTIDSNSSPMVEFTQADGIKVSTKNRNGIEIKSITINEESSDINSSASLVMDASLEPQPLSPLVTKTWVDPSNGSVFTRPPIVADMIMFYNPLGEEEPDVAGYTFSSVHNYYAVEEFSVIDADSVEVKGGILNILGVTVIDESDTVGIFPSSAIYSSSENGDVIEFTAISQTSDISDANGTVIKILDSDLDQPISSTISGSGTEGDPYIYTVYLGSMENVAGVKASGEISVTAMYSFSEITETMTLYAKETGDTLNGHVIKVDGTGSVKTSGYDYSAGETVFYFDPDKTYDSIVKLIFKQIVASDTLPYTATVGYIETGLEMRVKREVQTVGTLSGGVTEVYYGQRDNKAITEFILSDPNAEGIIDVTPSIDTSNPTYSDVTMTTSGGIGDTGDASFSNSSIDGYNFVKNYNVVYFDESFTGTIRIAYATNVLKARVPASQIEKNIPVYAKFKGEELKYIHAIRATNYYPLNYTRHIYVAPQWGITDSEARNASGMLKSVDYYTGVETSMGSWSADITGVLRLTLASYGQYALTLDGYNTVYIQYFANKYILSFDKLTIKLLTTEEQDGC